MGSWDNESPQDVFRRQRREEHEETAYARSLPIDGWLPRHNAILPSSAATVINVVDDHGADPTGASDDTAAFEAARDAAVDNCIIYIPAGTYNLHGIIQFTDLDRLTVQGDGPYLSIVKRHEEYWTGGQDETYANLLANGTTDPKIFRFENCSRVCFRNIGLDSFGNPTFGGCAFDPVIGLNITNVRYYNSDDAEPFDGKDRYAFFFRGCENVWFTNNKIEHLQCEFDGAYHALIENNIFARSVKSPGLGFLNLGDGVVNQHITVRKNHFYNSTVLSMGMLALMTDPPTSNNSVWRDIDIFDNTFIYDLASSTGHAAIKTGTGDTSQITTGNRFERIRIEGNRFYRNPLPVIADSGWNGYIWHSIRTAGGVGGGNGDNLNYSSIVGNRVYTNGSAAGDTRPITTIGRATTDSVGFVNTENSIHSYKTPPADPVFPVPV